MKKPTPNPFVSGYFQNGRLFLVRKSGSAARCDVIAIRGALVDNNDLTFTVTLNP